MLDLMENIQIQKSLKPQHLGNLKKNNLNILVAIRVTGMNIALPYAFVGD